MQNLLEAMTVSVSIDRPWQELYDYIWEPTFFPKWASGLGGSSLEKEGDAWEAEGPDGPVRIRFTAHNDFGVMDHYVDVGSGEEVYIPLRVIANGKGAYVMLTLFRQAGMSAEKFSADAEWVERDLAALRTLVDSNP